MKRSPPPRPSPADLEAARNRTIPDVLPTLGEPLHVLFCGINPSLYSAATGWHFARPGNRFWPALHLSGFTPRRLAPHEQHLLPGYGLGITNLVARATAQAAELDAAELRAGGERLLALVTEHRPRILAIAGVTAYRTAFGHSQGGHRPAAGPARRFARLGAAQPQRPERALDPRRDHRPVRSDASRRVRRPCPALMARPGPPVLPGGGPAPGRWVKNRTTRHLAPVLAGGCRARRPASWTGPAAMLIFPAVTLGFRCTLCP